jgi:hypothetical protein
LLRGFFGEFYRGVINFDNPILKSELPEHNASRAKSIRFDHVAADPEEICVNIPNNIGTAQYQHFAAVFFAPIVIQSGVALLDVSPHRPVVNDDALANGLEERSH